MHRHGNQREAIGVKNHNMNAHGYFNNELSCGGLNEYDQSANGCINYRFWQRR